MELVEEDEVKEWSLRDNELRDSCVNLLMDEHMATFISPIKLYPEPPSTV